MGGRPAHTGATADSGPTVGQEVWRYPVGWPWHASAYVDGDRVFVASPGLDTSMLCLDRKPERRLWAAENPKWGFGRRSRAYSTVVPLGETELAVWRETFDGWPLEHVVVSQDDGRILRRTPARPQEKQYDQVRTPPPHLAAHRMDGGREILVKSLATGRTWWRFPTGYLPDAPVLSGEYVYAAAEDGTLWALNLLGDQQVAWTFPIEGSWGARLTVEAGCLYAGANDGAVYATDATTGVLRWRTPVAKPNARSRRLFSGVALGNGRCYTAGTEGFVEAVDAETGRRLWRFECGGRVSGTPTVCDGRVFVVQVGGTERSYALGAETGQPLWSRQLGPMWAPPECDGDQLFIGNKEGVLFCLAPATGSTRWERRFADGIYPAPTLDATTVYTGSWDGHYYALDRRDGSIRWAFSRAGTPYHVGGRPDSAAPVLADGKVIVPSLGGQMIALDARTGEMLWQWKGIPWRLCNVTAAVDGDTVFASHFGNAYEWPFDVALYGLDLQTGRELWRLPGVGGLTAPIATAGKRFVIGSMGSPFLYGSQRGDAPTDESRRFALSRSLGRIRSSTGLAQCATGRSCATTGSSACGPRRGRATGRTVRIQA